MKNILVFPCGSEIGLEVHNSLKYDKHLKVFGLSSVPCHGEIVYKNYIEGISFISDANFISELNQVIEENDIDYLIPAYDDAILFLSEHRDDIKCELVLSPDETCQICRSKKKTYKELEGFAFVPKTYDINSVSQENLPLFAKPDIGQGSQGVLKLNTMDDVEKIKKNAQEYVIAEYLPGAEYTVDCFTDSKGKLLIASMRQRNRIKMGISVNSNIVETPAEVVEIARQINEKIKFNGVWFFQVKLDKNNTYKLLEIAPRVAGSMSTSRVRGFNFILNTIYQIMGYEVKSIPNLLKYSEIDRALCSNYKLKIDYNFVYIDFDDTIVCDGIVNSMVMAFLYQMQNQGKKIILLTRHAKEIHESLKKHNIPETMFSEIIHISDEDKSCYIRHEDAIFIDDSFRERYNVSEKCRIPVFDLDCIDALIDWRF